MQQENSIQRKRIIIELEPVLNPAAAESLRGTLMENRVDDVCLDASQVRHLGAQSLAVLLAAARAWSQDEQAFAITNPSEAFSDALDQMGVAEGTIEITGNET